MVSKGRFKHSNQLLFHIYKHLSLEIILANNIDFLSSPWATNVSGCSRKARDGKNPI